MASEKIGSIYVELEARTKKLESQLKTMESKGLKSGQTTGKKFSSGFNGALVFAGAVIAFRSLSRAISGVVNQAKTQILAETKVRNGIKATGGVANKTTSELKRMASELQRLTGIGDETILSNVQAQLLTFTKIRGDIFDGLTKVALDINQVVNNGSIESLTSLSIQLGKALNDPVANLGALGRMGIQFSSSQKDNIKNLVSQNKLYEAQAIILDELNTQYGGQAQAAADALGGTKQLSASLSDYTEAFGLAIVKIFTDMAGGVKEAVTFIEDQTKLIKRAFGVIDVDAEKERADSVREAWVETFSDYKANDLKGTIEETSQEWEYFDKILSTRKKYNITTEFDLLKKLLPEIQEEFLLLTPEELTKKMGYLTLKAEALQQLLNPEKKPNTDPIIKPFVVASGSITVLQDKLKELDEQLQGTTEPKAVMALQREIKAVNKELDNAKIRMIGLGIDATGLDVSDLEVKGEVSTKLTTPEQLGTVELEKYNGILDEQQSIWANLGDAQSQAMGSLAASWTNQIELFKVANSMLQQFLNTLVQVALQQVALAAIGSFAGGGILGLIGGAFSSGASTVANIATTTASTASTVSVGTAGLIAAPLSSNNNDTQILGQINNSIQGLNKQMSKMDSKITIINSQDIESSVIKKNKTENSMRRSGYNFEL